MQQAMALTQSEPISRFVELSLGVWRSQRSAHHLAFRHFEAVESRIEIEAVPLADAAVLALCELHGADPGAAVAPFRMAWRGESDWEADQVIEGSCLLVPLPDASDPLRGRLLRDQGYAETMPAIGDYRFEPDGTFVLVTPYDRAAAEEKIWFATPNLRFRVSLIKTSEGTGVVTASFASEVRTT